MPLVNRNEVKVYLSDGLHGKLMDEVQLCACTISSFIRLAIIHELATRKRELAKVARDLPLPGQRSIDGIAD